LTNKQIQSIHNYESKGGRFYRKEDLAKMYVIDSTTYFRLAPYVVIPKDENQQIRYAKSNEWRKDVKTTSDSLRKQEWKNNAYTPPAPVIVAMNIADTSAWKEMKGIGSGYARRIVKYRNMLGGFVHKEQLLEVYGFPEETYTELEAYLTIDTMYVEQIPINTATAKELASHPYIDWKVARSIVAIREQHGPYESLDSIQKSDLVSPDLYRKIVSYLRLE